MKVLKFGGTSVGSPERMKSLLAIISPELVNGQPKERQLVVLSAVSGTTNHLVKIAEAFLAEDKQLAAELIIDLHEQYHAFVRELFSVDEWYNKAKDLIDYHFTMIASFKEGPFSPVEEKVIVAQGELISTALYHYYLGEIGVESMLLPALDFMKTDEDQEPMIDYIGAHLQPLLDKNPDQKLFITQGFICRNAFGEIDNLRRGGSDYTASLIGAAIRANEIQIWTDIDGMHNNDPRIVQGTRPISKLSFDEAAELAYFGAKILHPQSVFPAQRYTIPLRLLYTMEPTAEGTLISLESDRNQIKSIAAKDGITTIKIHSSRMLQAYGFLRRVFEVFERYKTSIDMITTSEVAVALTIDDTSKLEEMCNELEHFGRVEVEQDQTIVCVVGDFSADQHGYASRVLEGLKHIPIRMISYGASDYNISVLVNTADKTEVLRSLHSRLFD